MSIHVFENGLPKHDFATGFSAAQRHLSFFCTAANQDLGYRVSLNLHWQGLDMRRCGLDLQQRGFDLWRRGRDLWQCKKLLPSMSKAAMLALGYLFHYCCNKLVKEKKITNFSYKSLFTCYFLSEWVLFCSSAVSIRSSVLMICGSSVSICVAGKKWKLHWRLR